MLWESNSRPYIWAEKTMTCLRSFNLEACEKRLEDYPPVALFDRDATDVIAEELFSRSYYALEESEKKLHTIAELRSRVLSTFPAELALLPPDEFELLRETALSSGMLLLTDWNLYTAAESLVRRLWCKIVRSSDGFTLLLPPDLCVICLTVFTQAGVPDFRRVCDGLYDYMDDVMYLFGVFPAADMAAWMLEAISETGIPLTREQAYRILRAEYDIRYDKNGRMMIVHPGLVEPEPLIAMYEGETALFSIIHNERIADLQAQQDMVEEPLYDRMASLLEDTVRPDIDPEDSAADLLVLAKQDVTFDEMLEVLSSMLTVLPTSEMKDTLKEIYKRSYKWSDTRQRLVL